MIATEAPILDELIMLEEAGFPAAERWSRVSWASQLSDPSLEVLGFGDNRVLSLSDGSTPSPDPGLPAIGAAGPLLGVIALRYGGDTADLDRIVVAAAARRQGIARALITSALQRSAARGCREMILEVRTDNVPAIGLYRSFGFTDVIVRAGYYGPGADAVLMRKALLR